MTKDDCDFEDPFELNGMAFMTHEDTTNDMAETFIDEFMRLGYNPQQLLALFRNSHYLGPNMAFEKRGEPFIRELIADVFARWGKVVTWPDSAGGRPQETQPLSTTIDNQILVTSTAAEMDSTDTDPMGAPIPKLNI